MKKNIIYTLLMLGVLLIPNACVDDYTDANPPHLLDAPTLRISKAEGDDHIFATVAVNAYQNTYKDMTTYDAPVVYTVSVIDAPGQIGDITASASVADFGSATVDATTAAAVKGKNTGEFKVTFTPNPDFTEKTDRALNLVITVADMQKDEKGESASLVTTLSIPITLVNCLTDGLAGEYQVTAASGNLDQLAGGVFPNDGSDYTLAQLEEDWEEEIFVNITKVRPGRFTIDEVTGGLWPLYYSGRANPALDVDFCGTEISGRSDAMTTGAGTAAERTFTVNGTVNEDGTIDVEWSYVRTTSPPVVHAKGSYTLTPVD